MGMRTEITDEALAERLKHDDHAALKILFDRHYRTLCGVCAVYTKDHEAAEEIVTDLFMRIWDNRHSSTIQNVKGYMLVSVRNLSLNYNRTKKEPVQLIEDLESAFDSIPEKRTPYHILSGRESYRTILQVIDTLPPVQRQVLLMSRVDNLSKHEIAQTLDISVRTVETTLYQSLQKLRSLLKGSRNFTSGN
jgi:RNA polymerase sigma-70 factor (family 1)